MKRATATESGTAITSARNEAHTVPKARGHTYAQKLLGHSDAFSFVAVRPGTDWTTRIRVTEARVTRIIAPASRAVAENKRSTGRCLGFAGDGAGVDRTSAGEGSSVSRRG